MMDRRAFLRGLVAAPVVITTPGLLMPVKALIPPPTFTGVSHIVFRDVEHVNCRCIMLPMEANRVGQRRLQSVIDPLSTFDDMRTDGAFTA